MGKKEIIIIASAVIIIAGISYIIIRSKKKRKLMETQNLQEELETINKSQDVAQQAEESKIFPLKKGMRNEKVLDIQKVLKVSPTGYFGTMTEAAVYEKYKVREVDKKLYTKIINS